MKEGRLVSYSAVHRSTFHCFVQLLSLFARQLHRIAYRLSSLLGNTGAYGVGGELLAELTVQLTADRLVEAVGWQGTEKYREEGF